MGNGLRWALAAVLASLVPLGAGCALSVGCDCGQAYGSDPAGGAALGIGVGHSSNVHCYCYCDGSGPETRFPPSRDCSHFARACETTEGDVGTFHCVGGVR